LKNDFVVFGDGFFLPRSFVSRRNFPGGKQSDRIGPAVERELENIYSLIRGDSGLQQDMLPSCDEFIVVRIDREVNCCCALKEYSRKLAEIRSFAFLNPELKGSMGRFSRRMHQAGSPAEDLPASGNAEQE